MLWNVHHTVFSCLQKDYRTTTSGWQRAPYFRKYDRWSWCQNRRFRQRKVGGGCTAEQLRHSLPFPLQIQTSHILIKNSSLESSSRGGHSRERERVTPTHAAKKKRPKFIKVTRPFLFFFVLLTGTRIIKFAVTGQAPANSGVEYCPGEINTHRAKPKLVWVQARSRKNKTNLFPPPRRMSTPFCRYSDREILH